MQVFQSEMIIVRCDNRTEICTRLYNGSCMLYIQLVRPRLSFSPGPYYPGNRKLNKGCLFLYRKNSISGTNPRWFLLLPLVYEHLFKGPEPSDMRRSAYQIGAARRSFATLQKPRRNRRFHVWTDVLYIYSIWFWCRRSFSLGTYQPAGSMNYQTVSYACAQSCPQPLRQWQPWANSWFALILACVQTPLPSEKIGEGAPSPIFTEGRGLYTGYSHLACWNIVMKKKYTLF